MQKGGVDMIVDRRNMRAEIARILALLQKLPEPSIASTVVGSSS
jgi:acetyl-CoA carboxylase carboxyl transferase subunit beta